MSGPLRRTGFVLSVLVALLAGYYLGKGSNAAEIASLKTRLLVPERRRALELTSDRDAKKTARAEGAPVYVATPIPPATPDPSLETIQRLRLLAEMQKEKLIGVGLNVLGRDGTIDGNFAKLLGLTDTEKVALQQTLDESRQRIDELLRQRQYEAGRRYVGNIHKAVREWSRYI